MSGPDKYRVNWRRGSKSGGFRSLGHVTGRSMEEAATNLFRYSWWGNVTFAQGDELLIISEGPEQAAVLVRLTEPATWRYEVQ